MVRCTFGKLEGERERERAWILREYFPNGNRYSQSRITTKSGND